MQDLQGAGQGKGASYRIYDQNPIHLGFPLSAIRQEGGLKNVHATCMCMKQPLASCSFVVGVKKLNTLSGQLSCDFIEDLDCDGDVITFQTPVEGIIEISKESIK